MSKAKAPRQFARGTFSHAGSAPFPALLALISALMLCVVNAIAQSQFPFQNPDLPMEQRVENILSLMTLDEKSPVSA